MMENATWSLSSNNTISILIKAKNKLMYQNKVNTLSYLLEEKISLKIGNKGSFFIKEIKTNKVKINKVKYFSLKIYLDKIQEETYTEVMIKGLQSMSSLKEMFTNAKIKGELF